MRRWSDALRLGALPMTAVQFYWKNPFAEGEMLTCNFSYNSGWWLGTVQELPGVLTQGGSLEQAISRLPEAISLFDPSWFDERGEIHP